MAGSRGSSDDPRVGLVGVASAGSLPRSEPGAPSAAGAGYRFTRGPLSDVFVGVRAAAFWEVGGLAARRGGRQDVRDLQWQLVRANYRLAAVAGGRGHLSSATGRADQQTFRHRDNRFSRHRYPVLSVAIATRNYGRWLPRCLAEHPPLSQSDRRANPDRGRRRRLHG